MNSQTALVETLNAIPEPDRAGMSALQLPGDISGAIDFSGLVPSGFQSIRTITIPDNTITEITGLPTTVRDIRIGSSQLTAFPVPLPPLLETLYIGDCQIGAIDVSTAPLLREFRISRKIGAISAPVEITGIPPEIERATIAGQPYSYVYSRPNPNAAAGSGVETGPGPRAPGKGTKTVESALADYFKLKSAYETRNIDEKRKIYNTSRANIGEWVPSCISCKKRGGTIFRKTAGEYTATCGCLSQPCSLNIRIIAGLFHDRDKAIRVLAADTEALKCNIIRQRMDTVFAYMSEEQSAVQFERIFAEYVASSAALARAKDAKAISPTETMHYKEAANATKDYIAQIKALLIDTEKPEAMKEAMRIHVETLVPAIQQLSNICYTSSYMSPPTVLTPDDEIRRPVEMLHRESIPPEARVYNIGPSPNVVTWVM